MQDSELKKLLLESCPVRPGQESRAWSALRERLYGARPGRYRWLYLPTWRGAAVAVVVLALIPIVSDYVMTSMQPVSVATVESQSPGIYATAFYSTSARAQVVWLNGMEPSTDKLTYLDPTAVITDPNGL